MTGMLPEFPQHAGASDGPGESPKRYAGLRRRAAILLVAAVAFAAAAVSVRLTIGADGQQQTTVSSPTPSARTSAATVLIFPPNLAPAPTRSDATTSAGPSASTPGTGGPSLGTSSPTAQQTPPQAPPPVREPPIQEQQGLIFGVAGLCLDLEAQLPVNGNPIQIWTCIGSAAQVWTAGTNLSLRVMGACIRASGGSSTPGTAIEAWACDGGRGQQWQFVNGAIVNPSSGLCLASKGGQATPGTHVVAEVCRPDRAQQWTSPVLL